MPTVGFFGKLPSHGDFVRARLPSQVIQALDRRITRRLSGAEQGLGSAFEAAWYAAPAWKFFCRPGFLSTMHAVSGVWTPSADEVGRCYPLVVATLHEAGTRVHQGLQELDSISRQAIAKAATPEDLLQRVAACSISLSTASDGAWNDLWWRQSDRLQSEVQVEGALDHDPIFRKLLQP